MKRRLFQTLKKSKRIRLGIIFAGILALLFGILTSLYLPPYTSELNFKEYSMLGEHKGSVVPASCVSGVHTSHPYDVNYDVTIDNGCVPVCTASQILQTTQNYRCFYYRAADASIAFATADPTYINAQYTFTSWQVTSPSCQPGTYVALSGSNVTYSNSGSIQTKDVYSCATPPPSVNLNFQ